MIERDTAEQRLARILYMIPAASGEDGASLNGLAEALAVDVATVLADLEAVAARSWYHPPGGADDLQIVLTADRVRIWTTGAFQRPTRLSQREASCLALGLRLMGLEGEHGEASELGVRLEDALAVEAAKGKPPQVHAPELEANPDGARAVLLAAARQRRPCRIRYLKADATAPEDRCVHPYLIAYAEGEWYAIGRAPEVDDVRVFRLDRILEAEIDTAADPFEVAPDFDPARYVSGGRVYHAAEDQEARVRYTPRVARWIVEKGDTLPLADGSVVARHRVSDPRWLVRHVLRYGPEAEVLEPAALRAMVGEAAARMASA